MITNSSGTVTATYNYTPYGGGTSHTGTATTPLLYDGQYQDTTSSLYFLRARYYDPTTAQFLTRDPLASLTAAPYSYASDDPLDIADPFGLWPSLHDIGVVAAGVGVAAALVAGCAATACAADLLVAGGVSATYAGTIGSAAGAVGTLSGLVGVGVDATAATMDCSSGSPACGQDLIDAAVDAGTLGVEHFIPGELQRSVYDVVTGGFGILAQLADSGDTNTGSASAGSGGLGVPCA